MIPELLAPAGNMEKAVAAVTYGADALYLAGKSFGMRASAGNFDEQELRKILEFAHQRGVRVYVTVNTFPHNDLIRELPGYLEFLQELGVDALIVADPGVLRLGRQWAPRVPLHLSTQANTVNIEAARFWCDQGVARLVLARELDRVEIEEIATAVSAETEIFVHGAMCMAYSGRCLLSRFLTGRDANQGACAQSCRWRYSVVEEQRPGEYIPISQEPEGTYLFNSKDLRLMEYLPDVIATGVDSLKIEGRMKSVYYVAVVVRAYRAALDAWAAGPDTYQLQPQWLQELDRVSHRPYYPGFFVGEQDGIHDSSASYQSARNFVGVVESYDSERGEVVVNVRNHIDPGVSLEIVQPRASVVTLRADKMSGPADPNKQVRMPSPPVKALSMVRTTAGDSR